MFKRGFLVAIIALLLVATARLGAQTLITNNSFLYLSNAVATGGTNLFTFSGTITTTNVLYVVHDTTLFATNSVTITGTGSNGLFYVEPGVIFTISNLTLSGGRSIGTNGLAGYNGSTGSGGSKGNAGGNGTGGASGLGGAIYNAGTFKALYCQFITNLAVGGNGGNGGSGGNGSFSGGSGGNGAGGSAGFGGAIYNLGTLLLSNSTLLENSATGGNGGQGGTNGSGGGGYPGNGGAGGMSAGAAIYNAGTATILACTIGYNLAESGSTQASGNPTGNGNGSQGAAGATAAGGGIFNTGTNSLTIINSTFLQNFVEGGAGGNAAASTTGFSGGNGGNGGLGAGGNLYNNTGALASITNCTFAAGECYGGTNGLGGSGTPTGGSGQSGGSSGANIANLGTVLLRATILAYPTNSSNYYGSVTDQGDNLSTDGSPVFSHTNSLHYNDPLLAALADNGGPTLTLALQLSYTNNPAINAIRDASNGFATVDQRGYPRPFSTNFADIGAYEYGATAFTLSGNITVLGEAFSNVVVTATSTNAVLTDQDGNYLLTNLVAGSYTITPTLAGYIFSPTSSNVVISASTSNINFTAQPIGYAVMGQVTSGSTTNGYTNVTVTLIGTNYLETVDQTTQTDTNGNFTFGNVNPGTYLVNLPTVNGISFVSPSTTVVVPPGTNLAIVASLNQARVTGAATSNGVPLPGVTISFVGTDALGNGETNNSVTGPGGTFSVILYDGNYVIKALPANAFTPASYSEALFAVLTSNINFSAITNAVQPSGGSFQYSYNSNSMSVVLKFTGTANVAYRIQSSTNLLVSNWTTISTNTASAGGTFSVTNSTTNYPLRFFRAVSP